MNDSINSTWRIVAVCLIFGLFLLPAVCYNFGYQAGVDEGRVDYERELSMKLGRAGFEQPNGYVVPGLMRRPTTSIVVERVAQAKDVCNVCHWSGNG